MSDKEHKFINNFNEGGGHVVHFLEGTAPDPVNPEGQEPVSLSGRIDAPANYYQARKESGQFDEHDCVVEASYEKRSIFLTIFPEFKHKRVDVTGTLNIDHRLQRFGINSSAPRYSREELAQLFKFNRNAFQFRQEGMDFVKKLRDFELKLDQTFKEQDDQRGNTKRLVEKVIKEDSDIPQTITLDLPIFEGDKSTEIIVDVLFNVTSTGDVSFWLESADLEAIIDDTTIDIIEKELQRFDGVVVIYK